MSMSERDIFKDRERGLEEDYFNRKERELIEKMRRRVALEQERSKFADQIGVSNEEILRALQDLGYTPETVKLLQFMPIIQIAWANGEIEERERKMILELARSSSIKKGSEADSKLTELLSQRPSDEALEANLKIIRTILHTIPQEDQKTMRENLINYCTAIASISRGLFSLEPLNSAAEREALSQIISDLELENAEATQRILTN